MNETSLLPIEQDTGRISFTIKVDGEEIPGFVSVYLVEVCHEVNRISSALLRISDGDASTGSWPVSSEAWFIPGNEIEISAGYHDIEDLIFKGIVIRHALRVRQQRTELHVECRDKAVLMTIERHSNVFREMKDSDIAEELLSVFDLAGDVADTGVTHPEMVQYHCTDWDFLISRMDSVGFVCTSGLGKIDVVKPVVEAAAVATVRFGTNLIEFDAEIDGCGQYGTVKAQAWDPAGQTPLEAEASEPAWTTPGDLDPADLASTAGAETFTLRQSGHLTEEEVQSWADARLLWSRMGFMNGRARVQGFSKAVPGITIALESLGDRFNGNAWVSGVRHQIAGGNWLTDLQLGRVPRRHAETFNRQAAGAGALLPGINGLHTGVVRALEGDPSAESRILVQIPSIEAEGDGIWARVATLDAGSTRGSIFLPEVDDEVLVGFLDDDPRQAVVLGGLHSSAKAPPFEASDDNHEKGIVSRSGMRILFNDEKTSLTIDTPGGNIFLLDEENGEISLADQNGNTVVLSSSGISMESAGDIVLKASGNLNLEGQMNLEMKAGTQFKAEGSAGLEVSSSAITVVKGSLVQIN